MPVDVLGLVSSPNGDGHYNRFSKVFEALELNGLRTAVVTDTKIRNDRYFRGSDLHIINLPYSIGDDLDADSVTGDKGDTRDRGKIEITRRNQFLQILEKDKPRVVLLESYPFMRQGWENLADALVNYKDRNRDLIIGASVRDITGHAEMVRMGIIREDDPKLPKIDDLLERHIDALLIHGDPHVVPLDKKIKGALAEKTYYTGYVVDHMPPPHVNARRGQAGLVFRRRGR
jgi:predicted glycosyltransferase